MAISDDIGLPAHRSHLFMLRVWLENIEGEKADWRGKVQHVNSGEVRYFRDWSTLEIFVERQLAQYEANEHEVASQ